MDICRLLETKNEGRQIVLRFLLLFFIVMARISVIIALAVEENRGVYHTPLSFHRGERMNRNPIGNTRVPKKEERSERTGRSIAVKNEEKHMSTQPVR